MIKINLLPLRAAKKKESAVEQISIFCVSLVLVAAIIMVMYFMKQSQIARTKVEISNANNKINELKAKIGKLEELKSMKNQVRKKLDALAQLRKNKTGPAHRLATLSDNVPEQLWLTGYSESGNDIKMSGLAYTEDLIATFMRSIESSIDYMGVELVVSEQFDSAGVKLKKFDLTCKLRTTPEPPKQPEPNAPK